MIKVLGIICLLTGFLGLSKEKVQGHRQRIETLCEIRNLADCIYGEISYSHIPIPDICKENINRSSGKIKVFLQQLCDRFDKEEGKSFDNLWEDVLKEQGLKREERNCISELGKCFGFHGIEMQLAKLERYRNDMDKKILQYEKNFQDNKKLILYFGVMSGLLLSIILL